MSESERYEFLVKRDGIEKARQFMLDNVVRPYRKTILGMRGKRPVLTLYKRQLIDAYCEAKKILRG